MLAQVERDEKIQSLVELMADTYSFVNEAEALNTIQSHKKIIVQIDLTSRFLTRHLFLCGTLGVFG